MNIENWKLLRDAVAHSIEFDMTDFFHTCGTPACLVGHAAALMIPEDSIVGIAGEKLALDHRLRLVHVGDHYLTNWLGIQSTKLSGFMMGLWSQKDLKDITQQDALEWLDECIAKGRMTRI